MTHRRKQWFLNQLRTLGRLEAEVEGVDVGVDEVCTKTNTKKRMDGGFYIFLTFFAVDAICLHAHQSYNFESLIFSARAASNSSAETLCHDFTTQLACCCRKIMLEQFISVFIYLIISSSALGSSIVYTSAQFPPCFVVVVVNNKNHDQSTT